jgi:predicted nucleic acid-binding protein
VLVYAEAIGSLPSDREKAESARRLLEKLVATGIRPVIALQSLAELHRVLVRKGGFQPRAAEQKLLIWRETSQVMASEEPIFDNALELASDHHFQIYDSIVFAAAVHARCDLLLSEDMQDGFSWRGVTVANPFAVPLEPRLARLLA